MGFVCLVLCNPVLSVLSSFCNYLAEEERAGCFTLIVILVSCGYQCSRSLPHGAMQRSSVCNCGVFGSYSLSF